MEKNLLATIAAIPSFAISGSRGKTGIVHIANTQLTDPTIYIVIVKRYIAAWNVLTVRTRMSADDVLLSSVLLARSVGWSSRRGMLSISTGKIVYGDHEGVIWYDTM